MSGQAPRDICPVPPDGYRRHRAAYRRCALRQPDRPVCHIVGNDIYFVPQSCDLREKRRRFLRVFLLRSRWRERMREHPGRLRLFDDPIHATPAGSQKGR
jgi:hypothetical protein